ncbi:MAG: hypothetical protein J6M39_03320 [Lachnospiraceae bacterium]|nr:hypothetical protein [Lachnospiraceae bacterium]
MVYLSFLKKIKSFFLLHIIIVIIIVNVSYAGHLITVEGVTAYHTDDGTVAKNAWVWIDDNSDGIEELYRFNELGMLATNYIHYDGRTTNDKGQLLEKGVVVRRMAGTGKVITNEDIDYGPKTKETEEYLYGNVLIPKSISKKQRQKIDDTWHLGSETLPNDEAIDNVVIDKVTGVYKPLSDIVAESGIIYSKGVHDDVVIGKDGKIVPGKNAVNFISSSNKFEKEVKETIIFNGDTWENCMEMKGNKSQVKFLLNKYNYMYFEISNENHTNETYRRSLEATLLIYADDVLLEEIDDFYDNEPQVVELDLDGKKTVSLKLTIRNGNLSERVFINNARFRKIKDED